MAKETTTGVSVDSSGSVITSGVTAAATVVPVVSVGAATVVPVVSVGAATVVPVVSVGAALKVLPVEVVAAVLKGKVVFYGEYRRGVAVEFSGKGGKVFHQSKIAVETDSGTITVTEFLADGVDWTKWIEPFRKGTMVFGLCRTLEETSGVQIAQAKLVAAGAV